MLAAVSGAVGCVATWPGCMDGAEGAAGALWAGTSPASAGIPEPCRSSRPVIVAGALGAAGSTLGRWRVTGKRAAEDCGTGVGMVAAASTSAGIAEPVRSSWPVIVSATGPAVVGTVGTGEETGKLPGAAAAALESLRRCGHIAVVSALSPLALRPSGVVRRSRSALFSFPAGGGAG